MFPGQDTETKHTRSSSSPAADCPAAGCSHMGWGQVSTRGHESPPTQAGQGCHRCALRLCVPQAALSQRDLFGGLLLPASKANTGNLHGYSGTG